MILTGKKTTFIPISRPELQPNELNRHSVCGPSAHPISATLYKTNSTLMLHFAGKGPLK